MKSIVDAIKNMGEFPKIQDKTLEWLAAKNPAMAEIFTIEKTEEVKTPGFWNSAKSWIGKEEKTTIKRKSFNLEGLLLHGALMKGEAIHDIAKDCLVKFFIKKQREMKKDSFKEFLKGSLKSEKFSSEIVTLLQNHFRLSR